MKKQVEDNEKDVANLISLGMNRIVARALSYLKNVDAATSIELEIGTGLRQPEVSISMRELRQRCWIKEREEKKSGKGRRRKIYSLAVSFKDITAQLEKEQHQKAVDELMLKLNHLKELRLLMG